ncbi:hypothetical protein OS493_016163 [Desmophyllum pertusum]|uniref:Uncharacterized protein n=1 Tax=Desmophyllum pertusum TaxID=174260 RepID=A0A9X0DAR7_9CNID|nr:hypothetical protein OS493_016163 [Desmophyllum pertusum]
MPVVLETFFYCLDRYAEDIAKVQKQYASEPFKFLEPSLVLQYREGVDMLREAGIDMGYDEDLRYSTLCKQ